MAILTVVGWLESAFFSVRWWGAQLNPINCFVLVACYYVPTNRSVFEVWVGLRRGHVQQWVW